MSDMAQTKTVNPYLIAIVVSLAAFMEVLDTTIVNVALRHIGGNFAASQDESTWVVTSYLVANGGSYYPYRVGWPASWAAKIIFYCLLPALPALLLLVG